MLQTCKKLSDWKCTEKPPNEIKKVQIIVLICRLVSNFETEKQPFVTSIMPSKIGVKNDASTLKKLVIGLIICDKKLNIE